MNRGLPDIALGVDIGGTKIALVAAHRDGRILYTDIQPTDASLGSESVIARIAAMIARAQNTLSTPSVGVGIACPGPVDPVRGWSLNAVNLGWRNLPLREALQAHGVSMPIHLGNDVNAGTLGEGFFGAARGERNFVYLAVGTGLGGGAVVNGDLVNGVSGSAMEIGHVVLRPGGRACSCGLHGCSEQYISGIGILAGMRERLDNADTYLTTSDILRRADEGDTFALAVLSEAGEALGHVMAWCATAFNPALIVIGGGLWFAAERRLRSPAESILKASVLPEIHSALQVKNSEVESSALGATALVWQEHSNE